MKRLLQCILVVGLIVVVPSVLAKTKKPSQLDLCVKITDDATKLQIMRQSGLPIEEALKRTPKDMEDLLFASYLLPVGNSLEERDLIIDFFSKEVFNRCMKSPFN